jgi:hypothetical protein
VTEGLVEVAESVLFLSQLRGADFDEAYLRGHCVDAVIAGLR